MISPRSIFGRRGPTLGGPGQGHIAPQARSPGGRHNPKQAVEANTTYEKKLSTEVILLRKALEAADRRATPMEEEAAAEREAKRAAEAEVLKTMEDTMAEVLYGGPPPSGQFDQDMEVVDAILLTPRLTHIRSRSLLAFNNEDLPPMLLHHHCSSRYRPTPQTPTSSPPSLLITFGRLKQMHPLQELHANGHLADSTVLFLSPFLSQPFAVLLFR
ncbi:hypothetical protein ACSQ67_024650 [Phaseolus vulgaris]